MLNYQLKLLIEKQKKFSPTTDAAVTTVLDFLRLWVRFHFPRLLRGISRIQQDVLRRMGRQFGNYDYFAARVENLFLDPSILAMDEYGIPLEVARKLSETFATDGDLDLALERLRQIDVGKLQLSAFESELVRDAQSHVITDTTLQTNCPGIFAAGAVRAGFNGLLTDAVREGQTAALAARDWLQQRKSTT